MMINAKRHSFRTLATELARRAAFYDATGLRVASLGWPGRTMYRKADALREASGLVRACGRSRRGQERLVTVFAVRALPRDVDITAWILAERAVRYHLLNDGTRAQDPLTEIQEETDTIASTLL